MNVIIKILLIILLFNFFNRRVELLTTSADGFDWDGRTCPDISKCDGLAESEYYDSCKDKFSHAGNCLGADITTSACTIDNKSNTDQLLDLHNISNTDQIPDLPAQLIV